jgi:branched-subunit amino acid permease
MDNIICYAWWTCLFIGQPAFLLFSSRLLHSYEADVIYTTTSQGKRKKASFNIMFCYIDDIISVNSFKLCDFVDRLLPLNMK